MTLSEAELSKFITSKSLFNCMEKKMLRSNKICFDTPPLSSITYATQIITTLGRIVKSYVIRSLELFYPTVHVRACKQKC